MKVIFRIIYILSLITILKSIKLEQIGKKTLIKDFTVNNNRGYMESSLFIGKTLGDDQKPYKKLDFTLDIGTKACWVTNTEYKTEESSTYQSTTIEKEQIADDDFAIDGTGGTESFFIDDYIEAEKVAFIKGVEGYGTKARGQNGIGLSRKTLDGYDDLASSLSKAIREETNMFAIDYIGETNDKTGYGKIYFGDLDFITEKKSVISSQVPLAELQGFEHKWAAQLKYIFFGHILDDRTKKSNGVYVVTKDTPNLKIDSSYNKAFFETVYGKIIFPKKYLDILNYYLKNEYFLGNGLKPLCAFGPSLFFPDTIETYICDENEFSKLGQIHFIFGNGESETKLFDIYLDYYDLFVPYKKEGGDTKYEFLIGFHKDIPDTFRFGVPIFKKFTSIFDVKEKTLTLASLSNKAYVRLDPPPAYKTIEFTLMKDYNYLMTSVLVGKPQKEIMFSIDIGSPKTWVNQSSYNLESETFKNMSIDSLNNTLYDLQGINAQDTFEYGNITLERFDFFLAEKVHYVDSVKKENQTHAVLGLGKYKEKEKGFSIINRLCESKVLENDNTIILEFGGDDPEGEKIGRIIYGRVSDIIKNYGPHVYKLPTNDKLGTYGKWYMVLKYIFIGNILKEKKKNGRFKVSTDTTHIYLNKAGTLESNLKKIILPYSSKNDIIDILTDYYLPKNCKPYNYDEIYSFYCEEIDILNINEIHFVLDTGLDIYLKSEDMFDCEGDKCDFLIEFRPEYPNSFVFGVSLLKKFKIIFNTTYDSQSVSFVSTDNIDFLDLYSPSYVNDELFGIPFTSMDVIKTHGYISTINEFGSEKVNVPLTIDIGSKFTWVSKDKYNAKSSKYYDVIEKDFNYLNLDYSIFGDISCDNAKSGGAYLQNFTFIYASQIEGLKYFETCLGLGKSKDGHGNSVLRKLYEAEFPHIDTNKFLLHFNEPDIDITNGLLVFGNFEDYLNKKKDISQTIKLLESDGDKEESKWIVEFKYIIFKNILVNRTSDGKFSVGSRVPKYILPKGTKAFIETNHHEILFPYEKADAYLNLFQKHYLTVDGIPLCNIISPPQFEKKKKFFQCSLEEYEKLGQLHFIVADNVDIYLDNKDLFYCDVNQKKCESYFQCHEENNDRFIFGFSLIKKFETLFDLDFNQITLIGEDNFDLVEFREEIPDPIEQIEFTYNKTLKLFLSNVLFGSQQKNLHPVIDIGSAVTWVLTDEYSPDESLYSKIGKEKTIIIDDYTIQGNETNDTIVFNNVRCDDFSFINSNPPKGDLKLPGVIAFGRMNEYEVNQSIVYRVNKFLNSSNLYTFMLQFDEDKTNNQSTGQIVFGNYYNDYIKEPEYLTDIELEISNAPYKWATTISRIYIDNILVNKSRSGLFNVSKSLNYISLNDYSVNLETKYDDIRIPYSKSESIFNELQKSYVTKNCKLEKNEINDDEYFTCPKEELYKIKEIHFILKGNENDIYFYPHDIFSCPESEDKCKLLITRNEKYDGDFIFGNVFLKKFYTLFDLNDSSKIQIYGKKNKAKINIIDDKDMFVDPLEKKGYPDIEKTSGTVTTILVILLCIFILGLGGMFGFYFFQYKKKSRRVVIINENGSFGQINDSKINELNSNNQSTIE